MSEERMTKLDYSGDCCDCDCGGQRQQQWIGRRVKMRIWWLGALSCAGAFEVVPAESDFLVNREIEVSRTILISPIRSPI